MERLKPGAAGRASVSWLNPRHSEDPWGSWRMLRAWSDLLHIPQGWALCPWG